MSTLAIYGNLKKTISQHELLEGHGDAARDDRKALSVLFQWVQGVESNWYNMDQPNDLLSIDCLASHTSSR